MKKAKNTGKSAQEKDDTTSFSNVFTIDEKMPEGTRLNIMPSISRLMDRKKLIPGKPSSSPTAPSSAHSKTKEPSESIEKTATLPASSFFEEPPEETSPPEAKVPPAGSPPELVRVQPAQRRGAVHPVSPLYLWTPEQLKGTADPMGPAIVDILKKGGVSILFLARDPNPLPNGAIGFLAKAFSGDNGKSLIWRGLKWNSNILPSDLWKFLLKQGSIEFPPPSTQTHESSARNVLRTSFGAQKDEWLVITRIGPEAQIRGLIGVISKKSIHGPIRPALEALWRKYVPAPAAKRG